MTKITVDKTLIEQAIDAAFSPYCTQDLAILVPALRAALTEPAVRPTYTSHQATTCASCGEHKHTPLRIDAMGGYVCLTCIDRRLGSLLGEFGYPEETSAEVPLLTERELIDLFGGYGGLHTTQLMQFRIVEQAVRQKAGLK